MRLRVDILPVARDQAARGTCMSIALTDAHQLARNEEPSLSADYLHYHAAQRNETAINDGVTSDSARAALAQDGQPSELDCPYSVETRSLDWEPPRAPEPVFRRRTAASGGAWETVVSELSAGRPIVLVLGITDAFWEAPPETIHATDGNTRAVHAVVAVELDSAGERVLVRNSWGTEWGLDGYGWVSADYVRARCTETITFAKVEQ